MIGNTNYSGIKLTDVHIKNFRSLKNVCIDLDWLTLLIGENNSGKTSFLDTLFASIGAGRHVVSVNDIFLSPEEKKVPKNREAIIDILISRSWVKTTESINENRI